MRLESFLKTAGWKERKDGWSAGRRHYRLVVEQAPGSWDRAFAPFLAKAILHAQAAPTQGAEPIAALSVKRATPLMDTRLTEFVEGVAPNQSWVLFDAAGRVFPHVRSAPELAQLARNQVAHETTPPETRRRPLFTDLNQWMLKVLLAPLIPETLMNAPRSQIRNASVLADVARVSVPAAARFVNTLAAEGFLNDRYGDLRVARPLELLERWRARTSDSIRSELRLQSVRGDFQLEMLAGIMKHSGASDSPPPLVLAGHSAAQRLGLGHVRGVVPVAWTPGLSPSKLEELALVAVTDAEKVDLILRTSRYPQAVFRGALVNGGLAPTTDIIQCWLDAGQSPARGEELSDFLWRRVLKPAFEHA